MLEESWSRDWGGRSETQMETGGREGGIQAAHEPVRTLTGLLRDRKPWKGFEQRSGNGLPQSVVL